MKILGNSTRVCYPSTNNYYTKYMFFQSLFTASYYSTSRMPHYSIFSRNLEKYNEEVPYKLLKLFEYLLPEELRLL